MSIVLTSVVLVMQKRKITVDLALWKSEATRCRFKYNELYEKLPCLNGKRSGRNPIGFFLKCRCSPFVVVEKSTSSKTPLFHYEMVIRVLHV